MLAAHVLRHVNRTFMSLDPKSEPVWERAPHTGNDWVYLVLIEDQVLKHIFSNNAFNSDANTGDMIIKNIGRAKQILNESFIDQAISYSLGNEAALRTELSLLVRPQIARLPEWRYKIF
jgi:hypothetical protein